MNSPAARRRFEESEAAAYLLEVVSGRATGPGAAALRFTLAGLSLGYAAATAFVQHTYDLGLRRRFTLPVPVFSIGGISLGGAGKTPVTRWMARRLQAGGRRVGILLRGHGGRLVRKGGIVSQGGQVLHTAAEAGEEAVLHARSLPGVAVAVGRDRVRRGRELLTRAGVDVLLLDDGFQYWRLARDLDLVLLPADNPFDNGRPLPRGLLREPPGRLRRAHALIVTHAERVTPTQLRNTVSHLRKFAPPGVPVFTCRLTPQRFTPVDGGADIALAALRGERVFLTSAIAANDAFASTARSLGLRVTGHRSFPDHFQYDRSTQESLAAEAERLGARCLVTTEKDAVKLDPTLLRLPTYVLHLDVDLDDPGGLEALLLARLEPRVPCRTAEEAKRPHFHPRPTPRTLRI